MGGRRGPSATNTGSFGPPTGGMEARILRNGSLPFGRVSVGRRVACIGAGNTAIDVVTAARRLGAEAVYLIYRRSEQEMPAFQYEYNLAKKDGVNFLWQTQPVRILGSGGGISACLHTQAFRRPVGPPSRKSRIRAIASGHSQGAHKFTGQAERNQPSPLSTAQPSRGDAR